MQGQGTESLVGYGAKPHIITIIIKNSLGGKIYVFKNGGVCVQKDGIAEVLEKMKAADVIVLASPMYYFTWTGLMKRFLDRTYPLLPILQNKDFYLITLGGVPDKKLMANILSDFSMYVGCFKEFNQVGCGIKGNVIGTSALMPGAIRELNAMQEAYELGKNI